VALKRAVERSSFGTAKQWAGHRAERSAYRLDGWRDSAFFNSAEPRSSLWPPGFLCGSDSVQGTEPSTVVRWRSRLLAELFHESGAWLRLVSDGDAGDL
jgi:hypothetical protein